MQPTNRFFINYSFVILLFSCSHGHAQSQPYAGLKAGLNRCEIINDGHRGFYKNGLNGGALVGVQIAKKWTSQVETLFSFKGCHNKNQSGVTDPYLVRLYYIDFPLLFQYHQKKISYELGLGFGYLREQRIAIPYRGITNDFTDRFNRTEQSGIAGIAYAFNDNFGIDFRYSISILPIRKVPANQYNSVFTLSLMCQTSFKKKQNPE